VGAKEGIDILPLCSRGIIVKVFANVFFKIGKPQCDMLAAARASPAFQRYVPQRKRAPEVQELLSLKQIMITRHYYPIFVGLPKPLTAQLVAIKGTRPRRQLLAESQHTINALVACLSSYFPAQNRRVAAW
jgi:hypothetical protein